MLTEPELRLLTAAVDGQLGPAERFAVRRLLRRSEAARHVYDQLRDDAKRLQSLPRHALPASFASNVLQAIGDKGLCPNPFVEPSRRSLARSMPVWANLAAAASVLLLIGATSFYFFLIGDRTDAGNSVATKAADPVRKAEPTGGRDSAPGAVDDDPGVTIPGPGDNVASASPGTPEPAGPAVPDRRPQGDPLTRPPLPPPEPFRVVNVPLPLIEPVSAIVNPAVNERFLKLARADSTVHLEVFSRDAGRALDRLEAALKVQGHKLLTDATAQQLLKRKSPRDEYVVYTESLTAEELAALLQHLAGDKSASGLFEMMVLTPSAGADQRELFRALGPAAKPDPARPGSVDIRKPISEGTTSQVASALAGQGGSKKAGEKLAVALPFAAVKLDPRANAVPRDVRQFLDNSRELKQFQANRPAERRAGATAALIILRKSA